jgi:ribonuclease HII
MEIGVDEAGRGPLFGPVYSSAVILDSTKENHEFLGDSKKTTKRRRSIVSEWIKKESICWAVVAVPRTIIDSINIKRATLLSMELAIRKVASFLSDEELESTQILVDGIDFTGTSNFYKYDSTYNISTPILSLPLKSTAVIEGDALHPCISAASILAKVSRDTYIANLAEKYPMLHDNYSIGSNMGYGAKKHIDGLLLHGYTNLHRTTFLKCLNNKRENGVAFELDEQQEILIDGCRN